MSATTTIPTSFFYQNTDVCPSTSTAECGANQTLAKKYQQLNDTLSSQKRKTSDMQTLYWREMTFTFNMILGCVGLGLYIKMNQ